MGQGSSVAVSCGVGGRHGLDLALLWLWCRPAAPIQTPAENIHMPQVQPEKAKKKNSEVSSCGR